MGVKGHLVNFALKYVKKMIPEWKIDSAISFKRLIADGRHLQMIPVALTHDDLAFLQYTGGTTGVAKGAMLTHGNLIANVMQVSAWCAPAGPTSA